jgi:hypothetical protein
MKDVQTLRGADINFHHKTLVTKIFTRLKKIIRFPKGEPRWDLEKLEGRGFGSLWSHWDI